MSLFEILNAPADAGATTISIAVFCAEVLVAAVPVVLAVQWIWGASVKKRAVVAATLAGLFALLVAQLCALHYVARPFAAGVGRTLIAHVPDSSFPSDHATLMAAVAVSLLLVRETRIAGLVLALLWLPMAWARVYVGVHFPSDLIGGALVGTLAALIVRGLPGQAVTELAARVEQLYSAAFGFLITRGWIR